MILPPHGEHDSSALPNSTTFSTFPPESSSHQVSWQSAFWAIVACILTLMMQNTGRVLGAPIRYSSALRSSPLICMVDAVAMLFKLAWMLFCGCSFMVAARHVWYDRFEEEEPNPDWFTSPAPERYMVSASADIVHDELSRTATTRDSITLDSLTSTTEGLHPLRSRNESVAPLRVRQTGIPTRSGPSNQAHGGNAPPSEAGLSPIPEEASLESINTEHRKMHPGSGVDQVWRLSIGAFVLGALPQMIKVFSMQGVSFTQTVAALCMVSFALPELLRVTAGPAGEVELYPMPIVAIAKAHWKRIELRIFQCFVICQFTINLLLSLSKVNSFEEVGPILVFSTLMSISTLIAGSFYLVARLSSRSMIRQPCLVPFKAVEDIYQTLEGFCSPAINPVTNAFSCIKSEVGGIFNELGFEYAFFPFFILIIPPLSLLGAFIRPIRDSVYHTFGISTHRVWASPYHFLAVHYSVLFSVPSILLYTYLFYRVLFGGVLSTCMRKLTGLSGSSGEFWSGIGILLNLGGFFVLYTGRRSPLTGKGTYKPEWTENLG